MYLDPGFKIYFIDTLYGEEILLTDKEGLIGYFNLFDYTKQMTFDNPNKVTVSMNKEEY